MNASSKMVNGSDEGYVSLITNPMLRTMLRTYTSDIDECIILR